ncbi:URC4/urg3 family protein [Prosthecodimorpha staleyi]|uniref:URC4/urg3 family protein n=1 Tax=Prosthecodimorpha staleyi TaxID=2840188 RepID=A0A947D5T2_9HYPH|nr:URC4/urg3 family protein [Prosthecodimorpha staleyi]MBT9291265.1 URC4/urg3 family protein [Prosthecodimorpha staleyi]
MTNTKITSSIPKERLNIVGRKLLSARAVRERAAQLLSYGQSDRLDNFTVDMSRLDPTSDFVLRVIRSNYPNLGVPPHSRWRHFELGEFDRWGMIAGTRDWRDPVELGRAAFDLAFVSVLLDAGAGTKWAYAESATGETFSRSEGLAIASLVMFTSGAFSSDPYDPLRADARALAGLTYEELADGFQVSNGNPLIGLEGRLGLLNRLGNAMQERPDVFSAPDGIRPGGMVDMLIRQATGTGKIGAPVILEVLLESLGSIWPGRYMMGDVALGDTWKHPKVIAGDASDGLLPLHKLSQWLAYSLIEPLVWSGLTVTDLDGLTGLAEYRNGGLFIDMGLLKPRDPTALRRPQKPESEFVVEWRGLTVALLDQIAEGVRKRLSRTAQTFPLACVLEGGTWSAGRRIAREKRPDGSPPIIIDSDGTVF